MSAERETPMRETPMRGRAREPLATPEETAREPEPFPLATGSSPFESAFPDWRRRLARNLSRRSAGRWEPLTQLVNLSKPVDD